MGTQVRGEHLLAIWRKLQEIGDSVENLEAMLEQLPRLHKLEALLRVHAECLKQAVGFCYEKISEIDSGIEDML